MRRWIGVLAAVLLGTAAAHAEPLDAAEGVVGRIIVQGNRRIEDATLRAAIRLAPGQELSPSKVRADLERVFRTGFFDDVQVRSIPGDEGRVDVVFVVVEKPAIREIKLAGNKKINEDDIREAIDIRPFSVLNEADIKSNATRIRDLYVEKGYYLAEVEPDTTWVTDDQVELTFRIEENKKVIVQRVDFTGNDHVPAKKIKRYMQTKEGGIVPWLTNAGTFKREALETDSYLIRQLFLEEGFVEAQVSPPKVYLSPDRRYIYVSIHVDEGERYKVGKTEVDGDFVAEEGLTQEAVLRILRGETVFEVEDEQWRQAVGKKEPPRVKVGGRGPHFDEGDTFKYSTLELMRMAVTEFYQDQGYTFVNVIPYTQADAETRVVDLNFQVDKGEKFRIGKIEISGNNPTFDKVIRRELVIDEGDVYRGSRINASRARLQRLGYFDKVELTTPRGDGDNVLDMHIKVSEQPTGSFSLGLGFSSLENFVFTGNVSKNNFLGLGYVMSAMVNWSALRRQWQLQFFDPYFLDSRWTLSVNGYNVVQRFQLDEYQRGGSIEIGRYLDLRDDVRLSLQYSLEDVGLTSLDPFRQRVLGGQLYRNGLTSSVSLALNIDKTNNRIKATQGWAFRLSSKLAGGFRLNDSKLLSLFGGEFNFVQTKGEFRLYVPLIKNTDRLVFRLKSNVGWVHSLDGSIIPFIHRFRAGGINSVRGFQWYSLGPTFRSLTSDDPTRADDRLIVGGSQEWTNNLELEAPVVKAAGISAVVFFDAGNAFGDPWEGGGINPLKLRTAFGGGVRWQSPIGPLRFELGIPLKPLPGERKQVFDFSIGNFF